MARKAIRRLLQGMTATALALLCATTGMAQEPKLKAATMRYVFEQWAQDHNVTQASFIALYQGNAIGEPLNADFPIELASLSKAITAICAAQIIEEGLWSVQTTSADVLGTGPEGITVGELITHTAGIGPDGTQGIRWLWRDTNVPLSVEVANAALARDPDQSGTYAYNNENYAILGQMISVALNAPYAEACAAMGRVVDVSA